MPLRLQDETGGGATEGSAQAVIITALLRPFKYGVSPLPRSPEAPKLLLDYGLLSLLESAHGFFWKAVTLSKEYLAGNSLCDLSAR